MVSVFLLFFFLITLQVIIKFMYSNTFIFRFEVEVRGEPQPTVTWYKNEVKLQPTDNKVVVTEENNKTTLIIHNVNPEDVGDYICVAENERGVVTCKSTLLIKRKFTKLTFVLCCCVFKIKFYINETFQFSLSHERCDFNKNT